MKPSTWRRRRTSGTGDLTLPFLLACNCRFANVAWKMRACPRVGGGGKRPTDKTTSE